MAECSNKRYTIQLSFEEIKLPPFDEILIIGKKCPQGKHGLYKSFEFLVPNEYDVFEVDHDIVEAVYINRRLLNKICKDKIIDILTEKVFPFTSISEIVKVDFKLKVSYDSIEFDNNSN
ncbi:MAG: hypothetical protein HC830_00170 [Bacteroidetes bacterium]|nr:hypothetical protein [Bacteroidales bacterium]NJO67881.1 hypothetical protein [Bacteroidota bacterium]